MTSPALPAPLPGATWTGLVLDGKYRVEHVIAEGGMGLVLQGTQLQLERPVAIKVLRPEVRASGEVVTRFEREARLVAKITSENVVRVHDVGNDPAVGPYMVMELLQGHDLGEVAGTSQVPVAEAVTYVLQACEALREIHALGIVHRDLKPANLFLAARPQNVPILKIVDFGISKADTRRRPGEGVVGTPAYMSPEQMHDGTVDWRADIWALGVVLHELLTGALPFPGDAQDVIEGVSSRAPTRLRAARPDAPEALEAVVLRCLAKDPASRFQDVTSLAAALAPFGTAPVSGVVPAPPISARIALPIKPPSLRDAPTVLVRTRSGVGAWLVAAALIGAVGLTALVVGLRRSSATPREVPATDEVPSATAAASAPTASETASTPTAPVVSASAPAKTKTTTKATSTSKPNDRRAFGERK